MSDVDDEVILRASELFKIMGDPTRVRILLLLAEREMSVNELAGMLGKSISSISHKLRLMRGLRLLRFRRDGRNVIYSLSDDRVKDAIKIIIDYIKSQ